MKSSRLFNAINPEVRPLWLNLVRDPSRLRHDNTVSVFKSIHINLKVIHMEGQDVLKHIIQPHFPPPLCPQCFGTVDRQEDRKRN